MTIATNEKKNALHLVAAIGHDYVVLQLIRFGLRPDGTDNRGATVINSSTCT